MTEKEMEKVLNDIELFPEKMIEVAVATARLVQQYTMEQSAKVLIDAVPSWEHSGDREFLWKKVGESGVAAKIIGLEAAKVQNSWAGARNFNTETDEDDIHGQWFYAGYMAALDIQRSALYAAHYAATVAALVADCYHEKDGIKSLGMVKPMTKQRAEEARRCALEALRNTIGHTIRCAISTLPPFSGEKDEEVVRQAVWGHVAAIAAKAEPSWKWEEMSVFKK